MAKHVAGLWVVKHDAGLLQGDECAEQDAMRLKEQLDSSGSAKVDVDGEEVTIMPNMVDIKKESRTGGYAHCITSLLVDARTGPPVW